MTTTAIEVTSEDIETLQIRMESTLRGFPMIQEWRDLFRVLLREAREHGFSEADVIRAHMGPVMTKIKRSCGCHSCKARRGE